jgi:flavin reductase (DIM6/NTAB) family NADH-FMN oxidoreductase RutF
VDFAVGDLTSEAGYKLLIGSVVPRPIAWVSTLSEKGHSNLAPISAFTFLSHDPPMVGIGIARRKSDDTLKDTAKNIMRDKEFVVNIANLALVEALHRSSFEFPEDESEIQALGLRTAASRDVRPPRLADAPIALECRLHQIIEFGERGDSSLLSGEVLRFQVRDDLCHEGKIDSYALNPVARLGGPLYAALGEKLTFGPAGTLLPKPTTR